MKRVRRKSHRSEVLQLQLLQLLSLRRRHPERPCRRRCRPRPDTCHSLHLRQAAQPLCTRTRVIEWLRHDFDKPELRAEAYQACHRAGAEA